MKDCVSLPDDCPFRIRQDVCWFVKQGQERPVEHRGWIADAYTSDKETKHRKTGWILLIRVGNHYTEKRLNEVTLL